MCVCVYVRVSGVYACACDFKIEREKKIKVNLK